VFGKTTSTLSSVEAMSGVRFDDSSLKAIRAAHRRKWTSIGAVTAVAAVGVGVFVYSKLARERQNELVTQFIQAEMKQESIQELFQKEMEGKNPAEIKDPDFSSSTKLYEKFFWDNSSEPIAWVAGLRAASAQMDKGEFDAAAKILNEVLPHTLKFATLQVRVRRSLASIHAEKGDYKKALAELDILEKIPDNPILDENKLFRAKVLYLSGEKEKAGAILKDLAKTAETAAFGDRSSVASEARLWLGYWGL
jgi:predicted negative regulator of RcsB-dependent stress response